MHLSTSLGLSETSTQFQSVPRYFQGGATNQNLGTFVLSGDGAVKGEGKLVAVSQW